MAPKNDFITGKNDQSQIEITSNSKSDLKITEPMPKLPYFEPFF